MKTYQRWNHSLIKYFSESTQKGTPIYLNVDDSVVELIRQSHGDLADFDFIDTIKQSVLSTNSIRLDEIRGFDEEGYPQGVAFLAFMVLVAYQMGESEEVNGNNYFRRFRELLGLPIGNEEVSRPKGMSKGEEAEEPLWENWNSWLLKQGFLPTAKKGDGPTTYIQYPISQTILRQSDRQNLCSFFDSQLRRQIIDAYELVVHLRKEKLRLTQHLQSLLFSKENRQRYDIIAETIFEVYEQWQRGECQEKQRKINWSRSLTTGLYRIIEDEGIEYWLYPKQNKGRRIEQIKVESYGEVIEERSGWYHPVIRLTETNLTHGWSDNILDSGFLDKIVLPSKDFWVLIKDFENEESGIYASWGRPRLGDDFVILCKRDLVSQLEHLRNERLIHWEKCQCPFGQQADWIELQGCKIISENWEGVFIQNQALKETLKPTARIAINLKGGLYLPKENAWLIGYLPQVMVASFYPSVKFELHSLSDEDKRIYRESCSTNQYFPLRIDQTGNYLIRIIRAEEAIEKNIRVVDWSTISFEEW